MARGQAGPKPGPKKAKTDPKAPGAAAAKKAADAAPKKGHNSNGDAELNETERRRLFKKDVEAYVTAKEKIGTATAGMRNVRKRMKSNGHTVKMVEAAILMATDEGEDQVKTEIEQILWAAKCVDAAIGEQLDMFQAPDRTPAVDRSRQLGRAASMDNQPRKAPHAPSTPQEAAWYAGYDDHQRELAEGFKKPKGANVHDFPQPTGEAAE